MDIQALSMAMSQSRVQQEAAVSVQAMALDAVREQAGDLARVMDTANPNVITDPSMGNFLDLSA